MLFLPILDICGTVLLHVFLWYLWAHSLSFRLVFGTLYPAYSSYKAVKSKDVREYVSILCFQL